MPSKTQTPVKKVVLAYSGGLDTSVILKWLQETYNAEVVAFTADIGQGEEVAEAKEKALQTGAVSAHAVDLQREFVEDFVFPVLRSGALYEGYYLLGTSFARPLIAKKMVEIAELEGADAVAHGATGKGNDQVRFELSAYALKPDIRVVAPWREWDLRGREDCVRYAQERGIRVGVTKENPTRPTRTCITSRMRGGFWRTRGPPRRRGCGSSPPTRETHPTRPKP